MAVTVTPVSSPGTRRAFIRFPWKIYAGNPCWVPPLLSEQQNLFNRRKFPFFEHSEAEFFLAYKEDQIVGRIAAIKNNNHLNTYADSVGFFGFFECRDDQEVANALFQKAEEWLARRGLTKIRGPENYSQNEECGLLIDAFDRPPVIMMPYNPPYYQRLLENYGFQKAIDLYAYAIDYADRIPERLEQAAQRIYQQADFTVRQVNLKKIDAEIAKIRTVYNSAWAENWGAVPLTDREIEHLKRQLIQIVNSEICFIAEKDNQPIGISIAVPDLNEILIKLNGRLLPFGIFKLLTGYKKITGVRVLIMGVLKEYRHKGVDLLFYYETFKNGLKNGYNHGEMSWILENNLPMRRALEKIYGTKIYKTYRLYEKSISV
jgi:GNAT superfamily N-acetyltransferase